MVLLNLGGKEKIIGVVCLVEWAFIHVLAGLLVGSSAYNGDIAGIHNTVFEKMAGTPTAQSYADMQALGSPLTPGSNGWPFLSNRLFLQHGMNLFFVGIQALIGAYCLHRDIRWTWLIAFPMMWADVGYFVAVDWLHLGGAFAIAQTFICSFGMLCIALRLHQVYGEVRADEETAAALDKADNRMGVLEFQVCAGLSTAFFVASTLNLLGHMAGLLPDPMHG